jgi:predicted metalloprotease with PDZ domain
LAIRGEWKFTDEEVMSAVAKTVGAVRDFWRDDNFPYFLITLKQYDHERGSGDGSEFTNAFWLYMSRPDPLSEYLPTLAHEAFHAWNPRRMGIEADGQKIEWFREGFTQYYGYLLVHRAGLMPLSDYMNGINRDLRNYPTSTNAYLHGRIIALWLDGRIRKDSNQKNSLDNVMFDLVHGADHPLTEARILETAGRYLAQAPELRPWTTRSAPALTLRRKNWQRLMPASISKRRLPLKKSSELQPTGQLSRPGCETVRF